MPKRFRLIGGFVFGAAILVSRATLVHADPQSFHIVIVNEVYSNADGTKQYVELKAKSSFQTELQFARLTSRNADGTVTTLIHDFTAQVAWGNSQTLLLATAAMAADLPPGNQPDFIIADNSVPFPIGRVVFQNDPTGGSSIIDAVAYGAYTGDNTSYGTPAEPLPTSGCLSLINIANIAPPGARNNLANWDPGVPSPQPLGDPPQSVSCPAQPPVCTGPGDKMVNERQLLSFNVSATDPNGISTIDLAIVPLPAGATFIDNGNGTGAFSWTPNCNQSGVYPVELIVTDDGGLADTCPFTITVNEVSDPPVARDSAASGNEDEQILVNLQGYDPDFDPVTYTITSGPFFGQALNLNSSTGAFTYQPNPDRHGPDVVIFSITDNNCAPDTGRLDLTTLPVNDAPVASDAFYGTTVNTPLAVGPMPATDPDGNVGDFSHYLGPFSGVVSNLDVDDGSFDYTPNLDFEGMDTVHYIVSDGELADTARVIITVAQGCFCNCHGDPTCDGDPDIVDVVHLINVAFRNAADIVDGACTHNGRSDINCDCAVDVVDVVGMVNAAFRNDLTPFCDPCTDPCAR